MRGKQAYISRVLRANWAGLIGSIKRVKTHGYRISSYSVVQEITPSNTFIRAFALLNQRINDLVYPSRFKRLKS
ncbi:hypothetical protein L6452_12814 [Arctium lappa]|uniref:Uncharacterized protein n=1 Tax=Arctium lappa TaxID=4217 RepID=A0ACB9CGG5_ARCLA|nr:hypothetical protein L6452_12814 [Arctium lappa]